MSKPISKTTEILCELARLAESSIYARACLREFLNTKPVIAALEIDSCPTMGAGHRIMNDEPSQELLRCLAACRAVAFDEKRDSFGGTESHDLLPEITPEMIEAGVRAISKWASYDEMVVEVYLAMLKVSRACHSDPSELAKTPHGHA